MTSAGQLFSKVSVKATPSTIEKFRFIAEALELYGHVRPGQSKQVETFEMMVDTWYAILRARIDSEDDLTPVREEVVQRVP